MTDSFEGRELAASLTVNDLAASLAWYRDVFGFAVEQTYDREGKMVAASLRAGDARVLIGQDDGAKGWDRAKGEGFSLRITIEGDVDELANAIRERGGVLESEPTTMPWGPRMFRLRDPDGFRFTISSE